MGAYYTKEDITDYISKNCILPFLFDEAERQLKRKIDFAELTKHTGDHYIYPAVKKGIEMSLPGVNQRLIFRIR